MSDIQLRPEKKGNLRLNLRSRVQPFKGSNEWEEIVVQKEFPTSKTAILLCDMWDTHWCYGAAQRCEVLCIKANPIVAEARKNGVQIIHAPSDCMDFYDDTPQRQRMIDASPAEMPEPKELPDPPLPIDDSDGGCDTEKTPGFTGWTRQHAAIKISNYDGVSDNGQEVYNLMQQIGIENLIIMGVHTNMCVLGRSFAIKTMTRIGIHCVLVRDLTDAMYNPEKHPYVTHDEGTEQVIQHIEKYWCPSMLSQDLTKVYD